MTPSAWAFLLRLFERLYGLAKFHRYDTRKQRVYRQRCVKKIIPVRSFTLHINPLSLLSAKACAQKQRIVRCHLFRITLYFSITSTTQSLVLRSRFVRLRSQNTPYVILLVFFVGVYFDIFTPYAAYITTRNISVPNSSCR